MSTRPSLAVVNAAITLMVLSLIAIALLVGGQWRLVPVLSGSMGTAMTTGDLAVTKPIVASDIEVGEVIAYVAPIDGQPMVIHRVINVVHDGSDVVVQTKGDANGAADTWTARMPDQEQVLQRRYVIANAGEPVHAIAALGTMRLCLLTLAFVIGVVVVHFINRPRPDGLDVAAT